MAYVQNTVYDKFLRHAFKKLHVILTSIQPSKLAGRFHGYPVLVNSMPKAGTHMLEEILNTVRQLRPRGDYTMSSWEIPDQVCIEKLKSLGKNQFALAHLPYFDEYNDTINNNNIRVIYLIRDPRDIICSFLNYVLHIDKTHMAHDYLSSIDSIDERLTAVILGGSPGIASLNDLLNKFSPWGDMEYSLTVKYEDFLASCTRNHERIKLITRLLNHVGGSTNKDCIIKAMESIDKKKSSTFSHGGTKKWESLFNDHHKELVKDLTGNWLIEHGYESNNDW